MAKQSQRPYRHGAVARFVRSIIRSHPAVFAAASNLLSILRQLFPPVAMEGLPGRVHPNDFMTNVFSRKRQSAYICESKKHFEIINESIQFAEKRWQDLESVLDFGCGYGRITRWFPTVMPPEFVTACDIKRAAVRFCEREFKVKGLIGDPAINGTQFEQYSFLFTCSVLTHLSPELIDTFVERLPYILNDRGLVLLTAHGHNSAAKASHHHEYLSPAEVLKSIEQNGYYFCRYPHYFNAHLGDTYFTAEWLAMKLKRFAPNLSIARHIPGPHFWDQDSYLLVSRPV